MSESPQDVTLPPAIRFLKWLVIVLTLTMIAGVITVAAVLVTRMPDLSSGAAPVLPPSLALPPGTHAAAVTLGTGWIAVVTTDERLLIFNSDGSLRQEIALTPANGG